MILILFEDPVPFDFYSKFVIYFYFLSHFQVSKYTKERLCASHAFTHL